MVQGMCDLELVLHSDGVTSSSSSTVQGVRDPELGQAGGTISMTRWWHGVGFHGTTATSISGSMTVGSDLGLMGSDLGSVFFYFNKTIFGVSWPKWLPPLSVCLVSVRRQMT
jgi:hypothetical protein